MGLRVISFIDRFDIFVRINDHGNEIRECAEGGYDFQVRNPFFGTLRCMESRTADFRRGRILFQDFLKIAKTFAVEGQIVC